MKRTLLLLLLLPHIGFAQHSSPVVAELKPVVKVHFDKMEMHTSYREDGKKILTTSTVEGCNYLLADTMNKTEGITINGYGVTISDTNRILTADELVYNSKTKKGSLRGHIRLTTNGIENKLGRSAEIEMDENQFRIN